MFRPWQCQHRKAKWGFRIKYKYTCRNCNLILYYNIIPGVHGKWLAPITFLFLKIMKWNFEDLYMTTNCIFWQVTFLYATSGLTGSNMNFRFLNRTPSIFLLFLTSNDILNTTMCHLAPFVTKKNFFLNLFFNLEPYEYVQITNFGPKIVGKIQS